MNGAVQYVLPGGKFYECPHLRFDTVHAVLIIPLTGGIGLPGGAIDSPGP